MVCRGSLQRKAILSQLFNLEKFEDLVESGVGLLRFGSDILTGRYENGIRERPQPPVRFPISSDFDKESLGL